MAYLYQGPNYQAIQLRFNNPNYAMLVILPDEGQFDNVENELNNEFINPIILDPNIINLGPHMVKIQMPIFSIEQSINFISYLKKSGVSSMFNQAEANFSDLFADSMAEAHVSTYKQNSMIDVHPGGVSAAAASFTGVTLVELVPHLKINRPFIFVLRNVTQNVNLFMGRLLDPTQ